jgi:hypothetical protein
VHEGGADSGGLAAAGRLDHCDAAGLQIGGEAHRHCRLASLRIDLQQAVELRAELAIAICLEMQRTKPGEPLGDIS